MLQPSDENRWHLDKKVPISLIGVMVIQTIGVVWFVSKLDSRVLALEMAQVAQTRVDDRQDSAAKETTAILREGLTTVNNKLDRLIERSLAGKADK